MYHYISIIVPVYGVEEFLEKCIKSILEQTYRNFELILVDDGSKDNSYSIMEKWAGMDCRIKVLKKENGGLSDARNYGMKFAKGEYILFVDSDDWIEKDLLNVCLKRMISDSTDIVIFNCREVLYRNGKYLDIKQHEEVHCIVFPNESIISHNAVIKSILLHQIEHHSWGFLAKRELYDGLLFDVGKYYEDVFMTYRVLDRCDKISLVNKKLYNYVQRDNSIVHSFNEHKAQDFFCALDEFEQYVINKYGEMKNDVIIYSFFNLLKPFFLLEKRQSQFANIYLEKLEKYKKMIDMYSLNKKQKIKYIIFVNKPVRMIYEKIFIN